MYEEASQVATDAVGNMRTVASFCAEKRVVTKYNQKCQASKILSRYPTMIFTSNYYNAGLLCSGFGHDWSITN